MRGARNCLLAMSACVIAACTALPPYVSNTASTGRPVACCSDFSEIRFAKLAYPSEMQFSISDASPAFDFPGLGISRFAAFELPEPGRDYHLQLRSYALLIPNRYFLPVVTFLDGHKRVVGMTDPLRLAHGLPRFLEDSGLDIDIKITPADGARYAIIHTTPDLIKSGPAGALVIAKMIAAGKGGFAVQGGIHPLHEKGFPIGNLKLVLSPLNFVPSSG